ncbi:LysM domain-containing protein [Latilactobacillus curvatus]|nr:LysM domain-containing protein [Latilactobacillus curvatus]
MAKKLTTINSNSSHSGSRLTKSHQALAKEVLAGHLNIGTQRQHLLGSYYNAVQGIINGISSARTYTIQHGDSFWSIANKLGVNVYTLAANNGKSINAMIYPGQTLTY